MSWSLTIFNKAGALTEKDHTDLYSEVSEVLFQKHSLDKLTDAQRYFVEAFEESAFGADLLTCYSDMVSKNPDISARNLHAFCLGHALGKRNGEYKIDLDKKYH